MNHSQTSHSQERLTRALETYAHALDELSPSPQLQARMQAAIERELAHPPQQTRVRRWRWALAASIVLVGTSLLGVQLLRSPAELLEQRELQVAARSQPAPSPPSDLVLPTGVVSLWPTQGTVFRVRSTVNGLLGAEQQYWIDVRMANDGSMRIERVFAADGTELFARPPNQS
jgi:hypothetical protein